MICEGGSRGAMQRAFRFQPLIMRLLSEQFEAISSSNMT
jgi:hypothetical protein